MSLSLSLLLGQRSPLLVYWTLVDSHRIVNATTRKKVFSGIRYEQFIEEPYCIGLQCLLSYWIKGKLGYRTENEAWSDRSCLFSAMRKSLTEGMQCACYEGRLGFGLADALMMLAFVGFAVPLIPTAQASWMWVFRYEWILNFYSRSCLCKLDEIKVCFI